MYGEILKTRLDLHFNDGLAVKGTRFIIIRTSKTDLYTIAIKEKDRIAFLVDEPVQWYSLWLYHIDRTGERAW